MKKISLSEKLGVIDFSKPFIFTFDYHPQVVEGLDSTDFEFKLILGENALKVTNVLPSKLFTSKASDEYIIRKVRKNSKKVSLFGEELHIIDEKIYKLTSNKILKPVTECELITTERGLAIKRKNLKNAQGQYVRPAEIKLYENGLKVPDSISYFYTENNPFDSNLPATYQLIVSNNARDISIKVKKGETFEKIKTLSFSQGVERGEITLEIDGKMDLRNLQFSFFKADVE